ncbi:MAG: phosphatase PAP2 family protein [Chitinophagaceae bacterium]|nr:MAG: phosphatase PAP2 family protein [Chitinophagaceae bacterium]
MLASNYIRRKFFEKSIVLLFGFAFSLGIFFVIAHQVVNHKEAWFDNHAFDFFHSLFNQQLIGLFVVFTFFGSGNFLFPAYAILVVFYLFQKRRREAIATAILGLSGYFIVYLLKLCFGRARPSDPLLTALENNSFPSGHALGSLFFFSALIWIVVHSSASLWAKRLFSAFFILLILLIGMSRIVLRYHYASDVLGGFSLGMAMLILFYFIFGRTRNSAALNSGPAHNENGLPLNPINS